MTFSITLRGYDRAAVDALVDQISAAVASGDPVGRAALRDRLAARPEFRVALRGYDRSEVDAYLAAESAKL